MLAAVAGGGLALYHAAEHLKGDADVVLAAVSHDGRSLEYAHSALRNDRATVKVLATSRARHSPSRSQYKCGA